MIHRPHATSTWRAGTRAFDAARPVLFGVLNVTPDSFFDGGRFTDPDRALERARTQCAEGADAIDVGAESTRSGADDVAPSDQLRRIGPLIERIAGEGVLVSIDTRSSEVAAQALARGAAIINDVSGLSDPNMAKVVAVAGASLVIMHTLGSPRTMQDDPQYNDVVKEVSAFLEERVDRAMNAGVARDRIAIDPGIGFGKRLAHNLELIARIDAFTSIAPVMVGVSRKSFIGALGAGERPADRLAGSLAASVVAWHNGARLFRTHDVQETRRALDVARAFGASVFDAAAGGDAC